jgi:hypothetical protein
VPTAKATFIHALERERDFERARFWKMAPKRKAEETTVAPAVTPGRVTRSAARVTRSSLKSSVSKLVELPDPRKSSIKKKKKAKKTESKAKSKEDSAAEGEKVEEGEEEEASKNIVEASVTEGKISEKLLEVSGEYNENQKENEALWDDMADLVEKMVEDQRKEEENPNYLR